MLTTISDAIEYARPPRSSDLNHEHARTARLLAAAKLANQRRARARSQARVSARY